MSYEQSKSVHTRSLSGVSDVQETVFDYQSSVRVDPFQGLPSSSNKLNRNLYKLRPVDAKTGAYASSSNSAEEKKRKISNLAAEAAQAVEGAVSTVRQLESGDSSKRGGSSQSKGLSRREKTSEGTLILKNSDRTSLPLVKPTVSFQTPVPSKKDHNLRLGSSKAVSSTIDDHVTKIWPSSTTNAANVRSSADLARKDVKSALKTTPKYKGAEESKATKLPDSMPELRDQSIPAFEPFKKLIFNPTAEDQSVFKHASLVTRGLHYSLKLLKPPPLSYITSKQVIVKELKSNQKTLVLDLDETLVHCCQNNETPDVVLPLVNDPSIKVKLQIRPYAREFLQKMKEHFEIIVFTASTNLYAETVVRELDPDNKYISYLLDRPFCLETKSGYYIKDLRILKNRDLKNMIIVDNLVHSFGFQIDNGIPILDWRGDKNDQELKYMMNYLLEAKNCDDVREFNKQRLNLTELSKYKVEEVSQPQQQQ